MGKLEPLGYITRSAESDFDFGAEVSKQTNQYRLAHGLKPICPECGKECVFIRESLDAMSAYYANKHVVHLSNCCGAQGPDPKYWDIP